MISISLALGVGVALVPDALKQLPDALRKILGSSVTVTGLTAIILTLAIPEPEPGD